MKGTKMIHPHFDALRSRIFLFLSICIALGYSIQCFGQDKSKLILGVLEYYHPKWANESPNIISKENPTYKRQVRIMFMKEGKIWKSFNHDASTPEELAGSLKYYPDTVSWFAAFDGKLVSEFRSFKPDSIGWYSDIGLHMADPNANLPVIGKLTKEFSGWNSDPSLRPLVLVSQNNTSDPDGWKVIHSVDPSIIGLCFPEFHRIQPTVDTSSDEDRVDTVAYEDKVIILNKAYRSSNGEYLIALSIDPAFQHACAGSLEEWPASWFYLDTRKTVRFIGSGMRLVDAGDYDNDGTSEVLFWESGYNMDGYVLFYNHFSRKVEFSWGYN